ncbi:uncharacterized protein LOC128164095 [Crassostrea angulata]|uniref:uncharacterized protein LOC128164095 n=1 Tax=Magallana angulata TaxID=2784310 RepID=UPI0022B1DA02|nr:uncharacterized protein LOC128164095 [Crassostrea angulata]
MDPQHSGQDVLRCDHCEALAPKLYCDICHHNLCKKCVGEHILDESKKHNVVPFKNRRSTVFYPICPKHTTKQCELFCEQCASPICSSCVSSSDHNRHKFLDIFERQREDLQKDLHELETYIYPRYQQMASNIIAQKADLCQNSQKLTINLNKQRETWQKEIDTIISNLKSNAKEMETKQLGLLKNQEDNISRTICEITQNIVDLKKLLDSKDMCLLVHEYKSRNAEFRKFPPQCKVSLPIFSPHPIDTEQVQKQFGTLSSKEHVYDNEGTDSGAIPSNSPLLDVPQIKTTINTAIGHSFINSVACRSGEEIWTCGVDSIMIMKLHNLQGQLLKSIETKSRNVPSDIAVTRDGSLVYTDPSDRTVNIVKNAKPQEVIRLQGWRPRSACVAKSGDLLVIMLSDDIQRTKVVRYSGSIKKQTIQFNDKGQPLYSSGPTKKCITENRNLDICVSDYMAGSVIVVDQIGNLRFTYTGQPTKRQFDPIGVATDSQSRILTAGSNDYRIHIIDQNGKFLRFIDNCHLQNPCDLCMDTKDNLFVAENRIGKVKKIQYCGTIIR